MSSLPIRVRLTLAFAVAMALVIGAMAVLVYVRVGGALLASVDQTLAAQAREAATHAQAHDRHSLVDPDDASGRTLAELLSPSGRPIRSTPPSLERLLGAGDVAAVLRGARLLRTRPIPGQRGEWRLLAEPTAGGDALVVARSLAPREEALHRIYRELLILGPLAVLLASAAGYGLAAAALRPVERMRRRAEAVTPGHPASLPVPRARDEISRLAVTLNAMLARLQSALEHERRFVADASHELRTPIALLRTEIELALRRPRTQEELTLALRSAFEETERLSRLADDLLVLARTEEGSLPVRARRVDLAGLLDTVTGRFARQAAAAGRSVRSEPTAAFIDADPARLEQALDNLVANALAHGAGDVVLSTQAVDHVLELHVTDRGKGFDPAFVGRAFDRFSRADAARSSPGAGLGLSIVVLIAQAHGGTASVANRREGGADVWLTIPQLGS